MKLLYTLLLFFLISLTSQSQQFQWAQSYEITNCNEVAALAVDSSGNIFMCGVYDASPFVPYTGNCYLQKTNADGEVLWTKFFSGEMHIGDMATVGNGTVFIGQANGTFNYQNEQYGMDGPYMFIIKLDENGNHEWHMTDETKYGVYTNISVGKFNNIALHIRGQSNLGDWIYIVDPDGNIQNTKLISDIETMVIDIAYHDERVYINGGFSAPNSFIIDTVFLPLPPIEHATFVLALNEDLIAEWGVVDTTINNHDGRIVANSAGVFVYEFVLEPTFSLLNYIKKFSAGGQLLTEVEAATFTNAIALYPDMVVTPTRLALFAKNAFDGNSHEIILYDHNLNLLADKIINGPSSNYSGQIAGFGEDLFVAQVHSGDLNFDNDLNLSYTGTGNKPYIAKLGTASTTSIFNEATKNDGLSVYPNPAIDNIYVAFSNTNNPLVRLKIINSNGIKVWEESQPENKTSLNINQLSPGVYFLQAFFLDRTTLHEKFLVR